MACFLLRLAIQRAFPRDSIGIGLSLVRVPLKATIYEALGINPAASDEEVRASLRRLIRKYYAKTRDGQGNVEEALRFINHASRILSDPQRRGRYDQELALSAAVGLEGMAGVALMALATDGSDGPTDAAGAVVDGDTVRRALDQGLDPHAALANNDSYPLLDRTEDLLRLGPTGTNVNDLLVILVLVPKRLVESRRLPIVLFRT